MEKTVNSIQIIDMNTPDGRAEVARYDREKANRVERGQPLYARIKRSSKYYGQTNKDALFKVFIDPNEYDYVVQGGPGGRYRLSDVSLYVVDGDAQVRLS